MQKEKAAEEAIKQTLEALPKKKCDRRWHDPYDDSEEDDDDDSEEDASYVTLVVEKFCNALKDNCTFDAGFYKKKCFVPCFCPCSKANENWQEEKNVPIFENDKCGTTKRFTPNSLMDHLKSKEDSGAILHKTVGTYLKELYGDYWTHVGHKGLYQLNSNKYKEAVAAENNNPHHAQSKNDRWYEAVLETNETNNDNLSFVIDYGTSQNRKTKNKDTVETVSTGIEKGEGKTKNPAATQETDDYDPDLFGSSDDEDCLGSSDTNDKHQSDNDNDNEEHDTKQDSGPSNSEKDLAAWAAWAGCEETGGGRSSSPDSPARSDQDEADEKEDSTRTEKAATIPTTTKSTTTTSTTNDAAVISNKSDLRIEPNEAWVSVWEKMKMMGWRWEYRKVRHLDYVRIYMMPKISVTDGVLGVNLFDEEGVKNYVRVNFGWNYDCSSKTKRRRDKIVKKNDNDGASVGTSRARKRRSGKRVQKNDNDGASVGPHSDSHNGEEDDKQHKHKNSAKHYDQHKEVSVTLI